MAKLLTEFTGTFFLTLTIVLTAVGGSGLAPLAIGATLMVMVYMGGHISGAHYNPAVSLAVFMRGKLPSSDLLPYWTAQLLGAIVATLVGYLASGQTAAPSPSSSVGAVEPLLVEVLFTLALCLVVLNVATTRATEGNSFYGLAIGFTVAAGAVAGGPISGGAFNPAVGIGPTLIHGALSGGSFASIWLYLVGPLVGGALAAMIYRVQHSGE